jgi:hypothetical protein
MTDLLITEQEFSQIMKVRPNTIRTWVRRKKIPKDIIFKLPDTTKGTTRFIKDRVIKWITAGGSIE